MSARDETEEIGSGTHERMVVDLGRLGRKLAAKARLNRLGRKPIGQRDRHPADGDADEAAGDHVAEEMEIGADQADRHRQPASA